MSDEPTRPLGVVEAFTVARDQCPSGAVQRVARQALEAAQQQGASALPLQAFYLLTAVRGWQGAQATRVKQALERYMAQQERCEPTGSADRGADS
jgi:hypothetical protein